LSGKWISILSNSDLDLDHRHLGSNPKLPLDISYPHSKFGIKRPKQTKVIERKPKVDARPPARRRLQHYNNPVFVEHLVKNANNVDRSKLKTPKNGPYKNKHQEQLEARKQ